MLMFKIIMLFVLLFSSANLSVYADEPYKIGWIGPLSGNSAVIGEQSLKSISLLLNQKNNEYKSKFKVNNNYFELLVEDDGYLIKNTISSFNRLRGKGVRIFFILNYGAIFVLRDKVEKENLLVLDPLDCNEELAKLPNNFLCLATNTDSIAEEFVKDINKENKKRIGILYEQSDLWFQYLVDKIKKLLSSQPNIKLLEIPVLSTTTDYNSELLKFKKEEIESLIMLGNDQFGSAVKQLKDFNYFPQLYGIGSFLSPNFLKLSGVLPVNTKISTWKNDDNKKKTSFVNDYYSTYQSLPTLNFVSFPSYDFAGILVSCIEKEVGEVVVEVDIVRECIVETRGYLGVSGEISFDSDGAVRSLRERLIEVGLDSHAPARASWDNMKVYN